MVPKTEKKSHLHYECGHRAGIERESPIAPELRLLPKRVNGTPSLVDVEFINVGIGIDEFYLPPFCDQMIVAAFVSHDRVDFPPRDTHYFAIDQWERDPSKIDQAIPNQSRNSK